MEMENACEPVQLIAVLVLVAVTVKLNRPVTVGVPLIAPALESNRPVGRAPAVTAKVYTSPPAVGEATTLWPLYAVLKMPAGNEPPPLRETVIVGHVTV